MLIEREGVLEDTENIEELKRRKIAVSIKESELGRLDIDAINLMVEENIVREHFDQYENVLKDFSEYLSNQRID